MPRTRARTAAMAGAGVLTAILGFGAPAVPASASAAYATPSSVSADAQADQRIADAQASRQADLVAGEDQRLTQALLHNRPDPRRQGAQVVPYRFRSSGFPTLVLTPRRAAYTFEDLRNLAPQSLLQQPGGAFLLREHILVAGGATLDISPVKPLVIRMSSGPDGFVSLATIGGRLQLLGTAAAPITFESWDESHGRQDQDVTDGRAYIRASGQLTVRHTTFSRLGFWSGRTGGLSVVGSAPTVTSALPPATASATSLNGPAAKRDQLLLTGKRLSRKDFGQSFSSQITDSTITGNAFGLFVTGTSGTRISNTVIRHSLVDGVVLHRNVNSANLSHVRVEQSGMDGVVISRQVEGTLMTGLVVKQNGRDGIVLTGSALAEGPSASGSSTRAFGNNTLTASESTGNLAIGIHVIGGTSIRVLGNTVSGGRAGIVVSNGASDVDIGSNRVAGAAISGIQVRESRQVVVTGNVVRGSPTGIHIRNSVGVLTDNSTSAVTLHAITFVGKVAGSTAKGNLLSGSGTSAIDLLRVTGSKGPTLRENDVTGWSRTVTGDSLLSTLLHPLTVVWMFIAATLIVMSRPRRIIAASPYPLDQFDDYSTESAPMPTPTVVAPVTPVPALLRIADRRVPPAAAQSQPVSAGPAVIDLAIREARLSPAAPRRRRTAER